MKHIIFSFLVFVFTLISSGNVARATTIMIIVTPKNVTMGVDSRVNFIDTETHEETSDVTTKIFQSGQYFFSLSGMIENTKNKYYAPYIIHEQLKHSASFNQAIENIKKELQVKIITELEDLKKNNPKVLEFTLKNNQGGIISVAIIGSMENQPMGYMMQFQLISSDPFVLKPVEMTCPGVNCPQGVLVMHVGATGAITQYHEHLKSIGKFGGNPVDLIRDSITVQIEATPKLVGLPIDIITIEDGQPLWIQRKTGCPIILE